MIVTYHYSEATVMSASVWKHCSRAWLQSLERLSSAYDDTHCQVHVVQIGQLLQLWELLQGCHILQVVVVAV